MPCSSSDLAQVGQWGKEGLDCNMQYVKIKQVTFYHHRADPERSTVMMDRFSINESPCLERRFGLKLTQGLNWNSYIRFITKDDCTAPVSIWITMLYSIVTSVRSETKSAVLGDKLFSSL